MEAAMELYTVEKTLAERVNEVLTRLKISKKILALSTGYDRTTISKYLNGNYSGSAENLEKKLEEFIRTKEEQMLKSRERSMVIPSEQKALSRKMVFESSDFLNILGLCRSCQEDMALGLVIGRSGYGKTHKLKHYAKMSKVAYIECDDTMAAKDLIEDIEKALGIPNTYGTIHKRVNGIRDFFNTNQGYLLIVDEADKLISKYTQKKMEILRAIMDQSDVGMIIAGEPRLESEIKNYLTRFGNRIDLYWKLKGLSPAEVREYMKEYDADDDAVAELTARACNNKSGCFRLLDRTMKNVIRVMEENNEIRINLKTVKQASVMMML